MADFGVALDVVTDLPLRWRFASGNRNLANRLARRLTTPRGYLIDDANYGYDVKQWLGAKMTPADVAQAQDEIRRECEKDEEVVGVSVTVTFARTTGVLTIAIVVTPPDGSEPFRFVLSVSSLTVEVLELT